MPYKQMEHQASLKKVIKFLSYLYINTTMDHFILQIVKKEMPVLLEKVSALVIMSTLHGTLKKTLNLEA